MSLRAAAAPIFAVLVLAACGSTSRLAPLAYPDATQPCPAGRTGWRLDVVDQRADRSSSEDVRFLVAESIRKSFPGCRWDADAGADAGVIRIELHRFAARQDANTWEARASWTVLATDPAGRTLAEFETDEDVSRPNYRGMNNAVESLKEAFDRAVRRTLAGLRVVSPTAKDRPSARTPAGAAATAARPAATGSPSTPRT